MIPYFDIHTHYPWFAESEFVLRIENIHQKTSQTSGPHLSVGLHPWFLNPDNEEQYWNQLAEKCIDYQAIAIGETGLDRLISIAWELQIKVFKQHIDFANKLDLPLIIHCVRAFPEVLRELEKVEIPVIIHGFAGKFSRIGPAIQKGYFISFGKAILHPKSAARQSLANTPLTQLFLETDGEDVSIASIYQAAADIKNINIAILKDQILQNVRKVFPSLYP